MADALLGLVSHPLAIVAHVLGETLGALPFAAHTWTRGRLARLLIQKSRAGKRPILSTLDQSGFYRIFVNMPDHCLQVHFVSDKPIVIFRMPYLPSAPQYPIDLFCRIGLPALHHVVQGMSSAGLNQGMDMIGHDAPGEKPVTLPIKKNTCIFNQSDDVRCFKPTRSFTSIHPCFNFFRISGLSEASFWSR